jgi:hypothetical protein
LGIYVVNRFREKLRQRLNVETAKSQKMFGHAESNECKLLREVVDMLVQSEQEEQAAVKERMAALRQSRG